MRHRILPFLALAALAGCDSSTASRIKTAAHLDIVSGGSQTALFGQTLAQPVVVRATDASGRRVRGATVYWTAANGSVNPATSLTDTAGLASTVWTLGATGSQQTVAASVAGAPPLVINATGRSPLPLQIHSCETNTATLCTDWNLVDGKYVADWPQGSHANIVATTFRSDSVVFTRDDPSGTSAGMHAVYRGVPSNGTVNGIVTWTQNGFSFSGNWQASWQQ
jgi:hypothetical protein